MDSKHVFGLFEESDRQLVVLALAVLSLHRPGYEHQLSIISNQLAAGRMFHQLRAANEDLYKPDPWPKPPEVVHLLPSFEAFREEVAMVRGLQITAAAGGTSEDVYRARMAERDLDQLLKLFGQPEPLEGVEHGKAS